MDSIYKKNPHGVINKISLPEITLNSIISHDFQNKIELYIPAHVPSRKILLVLKNDIYEILNFGQFHSGYDRRIIHGKNGVLFEKGYLYKYFFWNLIDNKRSKQWTNNIVKVYKMLKKHNKAFIFIIAPDKTDFRYDELPYLWKKRIEQHKEGYISYADVISQELNKYNIPNINCLKEIENTEQKNQIFPDWGTHWTTYSASLCLSKAIVKLDRKFNYSFSPLIISRIIKLDRNETQDWDLAELLNLFPFYFMGSKDTYTVEFDRVMKPIPVTVFGDSFSIKIEEILVRSNFTTKNEIYFFENTLPDKKKFLDAIKNSELVFFVFTEVNLLNDNALAAMGSLAQYLESADSIIHN